jgi:hypothetical protein
MIEKIKNLWGKITSPFRRFSAWAGGERGKRNLLGIVIDLSWGLITLPFKLVWALCVFGKLLFKDPKEAFNRVRFYGGRAMIASAALMGCFYEDVYERTWNEETKKYELRQKFVLGIPAKRWNFNRIVWAFYGWLFSAILGGGLIAVGVSVVLVNWLMLLPWIVLILSGLDTAIVSWNEVTYEFWKQSKDIQRSTAKVRQTNAEAAQNRQADEIADALKQAGETKGAVIEDQRATMGKLGQSEQVYQQAKAEAKKETPPNRKKIREMTPEERKKEKDDWDSLMKKSREAGETIIEAEFKEVKT